MYQTETLI